jgi:hypothetical protein
MYDHFSPAGVKLNTLLKPTILHLHSIFVLDVDGQLHEHAKASLGVERRDVPMSDA